ncbi:lysophospholipid acyltransferase family protein [soil metagenome]
MFAAALREPVYLGAIAAGKLTFASVGLTVRAAGAEQLPTSGPVVLASTHVSFPDFLFIGDALLSTGRLVRFLSRGEVWKSAPVGRAMDAMGHVPVDRTAPAAAYLRARRHLGAGQVVCVFPEAGISAAYVVRSLMPGAVALARETGAPLVPVNVWGGQRLWGQKRSLDAPFPRPVITRGRTIDVRIGEPMQVSSTADLTSTTRELGERLHAVQEQLQQLPEHRPRPGEYAPWHPAHLGGDAVERVASFALDRMPGSAVTPTWGPPD